MARYCTSRETLRECGLLGRIGPRCPLCGSRPRATPKMCIFAVWRFPGSGQESGGKTDSYREKARDRSVRVSGFFFPAEGGD
jgi:hypothetical protein